MPVGGEGKKQNQGRESQEKSSLRACPPQLTRQKETLHFLPVDVSLRRSYNFPQEARNYYSQGLFAEHREPQQRPERGAKAIKTRADVP